MRSFVRKGCLNRPRLAMKSFAATKVFDMGMQSTLICDGVLTTEVSVRRRPLGNRSEAKRS
eukprot:7563371-Pyramimonas_sp.AAC.1